MDTSEQVEGLVPALSDEEIAVGNTAAAEELMAEAERIAHGCLAAPPPPHAAARFLLLVAAMVGIFAAMVMMPRTLDQFRDVWQRFFYLPILVAALVFGLRVALAMSFFGAVLCLWYVGAHWGGDFFGANMGRTMEVGLLFAVAGITGYLSDSIRCAKYRAERAGALLRQAGSLMLQSSRGLSRSLQKVKEGTLEMMAVQEQLRRTDRMAALGTLTAGLAHEIRNPLGSIRGTAEILGDRVGDDATAREFVDILIKETARLNDVLTNFLRFAHESRVAAPAASVSRVMREVVELVQQQYGKHGVMLRWSAEGAEEDLIARIPQVHLRQILLNLTLNACQALVEWDGVREIEIAAHVCPRTEHLCIDVADSGPGIPEDRNQKVFDPFFTTKPDGTGLGLAIVARLVADARGTLDLKPAAKSRLRGAHFVVRLPVANVSEASNVPAGMQDRARINGAPRGSSVESESIVQPG